MKKKKKDKPDVWLEIMMLGEDADLTPSDVAFHMRYCQWLDKNKTTSYDKTLQLFDNFANKDGIHILVKTSSITTTSSMHSSKNSLIE